MDDIRLNDARVDAAVDAIEAACVEHANSLCGREWSMWVRLMVAERLALRAADALRGEHSD